MIRQYAYALAKASHSVGSNQIRNCSTIGGNIVNGQPAADSAVALAALGRIGGGGKWNRNRSAFHGPPLRRIWKEYG